LKAFRTYQVIDVATVTDTCLPEVEFSS